MELFLEYDTGWEALKLLDTLASTRAAHDDVIAHLAQAN